MSGELISRVSGPAEQPKGVPLVQNRLAILLALLCIAVSLVFLGRSRPTAQPANGVYVIVSGESHRTWADSASDQLATVGKSVRSTVTRYILPVRIPSYVVGMIICTLIAGLILVYPR